MRVESGSLPRLMLVTNRHATGGRDLVSVVLAAVQGGVRFIQVREKDLPDGALAYLVQRLLNALPASVLLTVNDRPAVARAQGIGLHLPAVGINADVSGIGLVGRSVHDLEEAAAALAARVSYLVVGTIFPTESKPGHPGAGPRLVREVSELAGAVPVYAIGGINAENVAAVLQAGAYGVAVRSAILSAADPPDAARTIVRRLDEAL